jgi:hypothetical protein
LAPTRDRRCVSFETASTETPPPHLPGTIDRAETCYIAKIEDEDDDEDEYD